MRISKEAHALCTSMIESEIRGAQVKIRRNKDEIKRLAKEQRALKSELGALFTLIKTLKQ